MHTLQSLSADLILEIIQHLDVEEICFKVNTLSKMFNQLCKQPRLWRDICLKLEINVDNPLKLSQRSPEDQTRHYQNLLKEFYSVTSWSKTHSSPSAAFSTDFSEFFSQSDQIWVTALSKPLNQIEDPQPSYYAEFTAGGLCSIGIVTPSFKLSNTAQIGDKGSCGYTFSGNVPMDAKWIIQGKASYFGKGDRISVLVDITDGTATFFKNGSQQHTHGISAWLEVRLHFAATVFSAGTTVKRHKESEEKHREHAMQFNTNRKMGHKLL